MDASTVTLKGTGFREPYATHARTHRKVFLEEIRRFIGTADRQELAALRVEIRARRHAVQGSGKRGRPRGSKLRGLAAEPQPSELEKQHREQEALRDACLFCLDFPDLRNSFLRQALSFVQEANKSDLAVMRKAVANRAKTPGIRKKRGRPSAPDDDELMYQARRVAWWHRVEEKTWKEIALAAGLRWDDNDEEQGRKIRWTLQRREEYLAARLWQAVPPGYIVQHGERKGEFKLGALDHKPLQQLIWFRTALPFKTHPEQCKRIVLALWPRASDAAWRETKRNLSYARPKRDRSS